MQRANATRVGANPGDGVGAGLEARANVELQHDGRLGVLREDFHGAATVNGRELRLVIVIAGVQAGFFELLVGRIERVGDGFPPFETGWLRMAGGYYDVFAPEDQVSIASLGDVFL